MVIYHKDLLKQQEEKKSDELTVIDAYNIDYYKIKIIRNKIHNSELTYTYTLDERIFNETIFYYIKIISRQISKKNFFADYSLTTLSPTAKNIFSTIEHIILDIIEHELVLSEIVKEKLKKLKTYITFFVMGLDSFYPLLIDSNVQEIYIDSEGTNPYLDHFRYGRCIVTHKFSLPELKKLVNLAILNGNLRLSEKSPSIKTEIITDYFHIRVTIDIPPITQSKYALDIRKAKKKVITITDLLKQKVLTIEALAFLYFTLKYKINIVVIGVPGSGKTTFANAIDMLTPIHWRKIYIEDVFESLDLRKYGQHQFKLKVNNISTTKYSEIIKILHRNPDWLYLGEILTREHSQALFHAILSGIVGIQTYHAGSPNMAISRWHNYHKIPYSIISNVGLLISISKYLKPSGGYIFRITDISEVIPTQEEKPPLINPLFTWNHLTDELNFCKQSFSEIHLIKHIIKKYGLTMSEVNQELMRAHHIFKTILENNITSIDALIHIVNNQIFRNIGRGVV